MQQANQTQRIAISTHESGEEEGIMLTLEGFKDVALCLSVRQARAFAGDLIQQTHRIEVKNSLKKAKTKAIQAAVEASGMPLIFAAPQRA